MAIITYPLVLADVKNTIRRGAKHNGKLLLIT
jgi:hypothetical protein